MSYAMRVLSGLIVLLAAVGMAAPAMGGTLDSVPLCRSTSPNAKTPPAIEMMGGVVVAEAVASSRVLASIHDGKGTLCTQEAGPGIVSLITETRGGGAPYILKFDGVPIVSSP